jgi:hypothetical protein
MIRLAVACRTATVLLTMITLHSPTEPAAAQEIGLTPLETKEIARGYRAEALKLKPVINDKKEDIGRITDYVFGKDGNSVFVVLAVGDFTGLSGQQVAIPLRNLKLEDPTGYIVLPGASRAALESLPVFVSSP